MCLMSVSSPLKHWVVRHTENFRSLVNQFLGPSSYVKKKKYNNNNKRCKNRWVAEYAAKLDLKIQNTLPVLYEVRVVKKKTSK